MWLKYEELTMNKNTIIQLTLVIAIVAGYFLIDFNKLQSMIYGEGEFITQDAQCDLHKSTCEVTIQDGTKLTFEIVQKDIPMMKPLDFKVTSSNPNLDDLKLVIYATNMNMGIYELKLKSKGNGNYEAIGTLPSCPVGKMDWNVDIPVQKIDKKIGARFNFKTDI